MKQHRSEQLKDTWKLGALLYLLAFNFPLLEIFNHTSQVFGIPLLIFFLFTLWVLFIVLMAFFVHHLRRQDEEEHYDTERGEG